MHGLEIDGSIYCSSYAYVRNARVPNDARVLNVYRALRVQGNGIFFCILTAT